ncbi:hypothetical protein E2C01_024420 [Portunus trituberculatus]|uniref:Uncharacterized protein n=1 Tax=Portunus trituberculatus TaxID=210409 RepID=A0A5B7EAL5_PORTR|nr:hypothetical protein [Portunus trituberculatus]
MLEREAKVVARLRSSLHQLEGTCVGEVATDTPAAVRPPPHSLPSPPSSSSSPPSARLLACLPPRLPPFLPACLPAHLT